MAANLFTQLQALLPDPPQRIGTVVAVLGNTALLQYPDGGVAQAIGPATPGQQVFERGGQIQGQAPNLPVTAVEL